MYLCEDPDGGLLDSDMPSFNAPPAALLNMNQPGSSSGASGGAAGDVIGNTGGVMSFKLFGCIIKLMHEIAMQTKT